MVRYYKQVGFTKVTYGTFISMLTREERAWDLLSKLPTIKEPFSKAIKFNSFVEKDVAYKIYRELIAKGNEISRELYGLTTSNNEKVITLEEITYKKYANDVAKMFQDDCVWAKRYILKVVQK